MKARIFSTIRDVPQEHWDGLLNNRSCAFSREFWKVIEDSGLNDFQYKHVIFYDEDDRPVALTSFYSITTDLAIFARNRLRSTLGAIRKIFPNFLKLRMLECGTPLTVSSPPIAMAEGFSVQKIIPALHNLLLNTARTEKQFMIVVRDFEANAGTLQNDLRQFGYHWVENLPNTYLDIKWSTPEAYLDSLKSYYRSKLLRHLRKNADQSIRHELIDDFAPMAEILCSQWLVVHRQADELQREVLTPAFYRKFSDRMGSRSKVLLFYKQDELVGHALLLMDGDMLRWLYFGRKKAGNDSLYLYVGYTVIETAIRLGAKRLELGLTTYSIKQDLGAQVKPSNLALLSPYRLANPIVGLVYPLLNHLPRIQNKNVFKQVT